MAHGVWVRALFAILRPRADAPRGPLPSLDLNPPPLRCRPPVWARGGHAQTILGHLIPSPGASLAAGGNGMERHEVELEDGDRLVASYRAGPSPLVVSLFHGLGGSTNADYMRRTAQVCGRRGHAVFAVNHRGCGDGAGLARGTYHSGRSDDVARALAAARLLRPDARHVAIGFSLSANALLLQAACRLTPLPDALIAVNPPIDLADASARISSGRNRVYDWRFVRQCKRAVASRVTAGLLQQELRLPPFATLRDVDEQFTAPHGGFRDADDYYRRCSTHLRLHEIDVPTVILAACDDPFISAESFERARLSPTLHLQLERTGGHVGYLTARPTPLGTRRWLDYAIDHYLGQLE